VGGGGHESSEGEFILLVQTAVKMQHLKGKVLTLLQGGGERIGGHGKRWVGIRKDYQGKRRLRKTINP